MAAEANTAPAFGEDTYSFSLAENEDGSTTLRMTVPCKPAGD